MIKKAYNNPIDVWWMIQGETRMFLYTYARWMVRVHIKEQYIFRSIAASKCTDNKSCLFCGCKTPDLYFANKPCGLTKVSAANRRKVFKQNNPCYGKMLNKKQWKEYNEKL